MAYQSALTRVRDEKLTLLVDRDAMAVDDGDKDFGEDFVAVEEAIEEQKEAAASRRWAAELPVRGKPPQ